MRVIANVGNLMGAQDLREVPTPMQPEDPRLKMAEAELQSAIVELLGFLKYDWYHTRDSRGSNAGFPDLTVWGGRHNRLLFAELKTQKGKISAQQADTLRGLANAGQHVYIWRPYDWITGSVERILRGPRERT